MSYYYRKENPFISPPISRGFLFWFGFHLEKGFSLEWLRLLDLGLGFVLGAPFVLGLRFVLGLCLGKEFLLYGNFLS